MNLIGSGLNNNPNNLDTESPPIGGKIVSCEAAYWSAPRLIMKSSQSKQNQSINSTNTFIRYIFGEETKLTGKKN